MAFLSYSTKGSARHALVDKMREACELTSQRFAAIGLDVTVDGALQGAAALVPAVGASKNKGGAIQGDANVLIFPDLQAGNIAYKLVERLAGAIAYGPLAYTFGRRGQLMSPIHVCQIVSNRYERGAMILTSNTAFKQWPAIFNNDATLTSALLDRLLHHAETVDITGKSYRMKAQPDT